MQGDKIEELKNDHLSGAIEILHKAAQILKIDRNPETVEMVRSTHPDMAPLYKICEMVLVSDNPEKEISEFMKAIESSTEIIGDKLHPLLEEHASILTYSRSSTVKEVLIYLHRLGRTFEVYVAESRPGFEGRILADELGQEGINTILMTDMAAISHLVHVDYLLIGADRVTPPFFVNKVGTKAYLEIAQLYNIPCYLLADQSKVIVEWPWEVDRKDHAPFEVCNEKLKGVHVVNPYFERIPLKLVSHLSDD